MDPLITAGELRDYIQRPIPDAALDLAVRGASGAVRAYCRWDVTLSLGETFAVDGSGSTVLGLPTLNLLAVASVTVDGEELDPAGYRWTRRGQLYRSAPWPRWSQVLVECDHGYDPAPDVVRLVALSLGARYAGNPESMHIATVGSVQKTFAVPELTTLELGLLDEYRLP